MNFLLSTEFYHIFKFEVRPRHFRIKLLGISAHNEYLVFLRQDSYFIVTINLSRKFYYGDQKTQFTLFGKNKIPEKSKLI